MLATELLFACIYCLVDDAITVGDLWIPRRPGPAPDCTDAELLCIALVRHLLGRGAHTFEGLLTRTAATLAAHTLLLTLPAEAI
jgi:hypothetical protein